MSSRLPLLVASALFSIAQALPAADDLVSTELISVGVGGDLSKYFFNNNGAVAQMMATTQGISQPIIYKGPRIMTFYRTEAEASAKTPPEPALTVALPSEADRSLLIFTFTAPPEKVAGTEPAPESDKPDKEAESARKEAPADAKVESPDPNPTVTGKAYGITNSSFGECDYRLFNLSNLEVQAELGETIITIPPGETKDVKGDSIRGEESSITIKLSVKQDDKLRPVYSSIWGDRPERRNFLLMIADDANKRRPVSVKQFYDVPSIKATLSSFTIQNEMNGHSE